MKKILLILTIILIFLNSAFAIERIISFKSHVDIGLNGDLQVTEAIKVNAEGNKIKRGIYRDFPTKYKTKSGLNYQTAFNVISVTKNGINEPYFIKSIPNGKRLYIGQKDVFLNPGIYEYQIKYITNNQLGFFEDYDEIYWNVTGNDWDFDIDYVEFYATINGKPIDNVISYGGYTGVQNSKEKNFNVKKDDTGNLIFTAYHLKSKEGLTVFIDFPKGIVHEPTKQELAARKAKSNMTSLIAAAGLIVLIIVNTLIWFFVGKDPEKGVLVPLFEPPHNISAGATRYLYKMGYDDKVTVAAIISMAAKGALHIKEEDGEISLFKKDNILELSSAEKVFYDKMFQRTDELYLDETTDAERFRNALKKYKQSLKGEFEKTYFNSNKQYLIPGVLISLASLIGAVYFASDRYTAIFMTAWLTIWSFGVGALSFRVFNLWKIAIKTKDWTSFLPAIFLTAFITPFIIGEIFGLFMLTQATSIIFIIILLSHVVLQILFYHWMKAPTRLGRKILDQIEGFKEFLTRVEKDRLKLMYSKEELPKIFERYLPYAIALDVEEKWANAIESALKELKSSYTPNDIYWYSGTVAAGSLAGFSQGISAAALDATSAASSPPGSSSGGIGGSSGGGGGGGGGGGW